MKKDHKGTVQSNICTVLFEFERFMPNPFRMTSDPSVRPLAWQTVKPGCLAGKSSEESRGSLQ
ncbi:hypothetical protein [Cohnella nanjingensis]|uniref:Uncharacterized protein n=1 Tax=Cohnella nanjingensis TaxID=1387779 RepID=A0A7X0RRW2_9BACL|nr:hypothetical protein [Cohnella nanjingensis]MBB6672552.1 hypothetical protein [Cohnella nanjingensis]